MVLSAADVKSADQIKSFHGPANWEQHTKIIAVSNWHHIAYAYLANGLQQVICALLPYRAERRTQRGAESTYEGKEPLGEGQRRLGG